MPRRVFEVERPEGGGEFFLALYVHHKCPDMARAELMGQAYEDLDLLQFAYGLIGYEMPLDTPFDVTSTLPCEACMKYVTTTFVWTGKRHIFLADGTNKKVS